MEHYSIKNYEDHVSMKNVDTLRGKGFFKFINVDKEQKVGKNKNCPACYRLLMIFLLLFFFY